MKIVYVTPLGKSATKQKDALLEAMQQFHFTDLVIFTSSNLYFELIGNLFERYPDIGISICPITCPFSGNSDYMDILGQLIQFVDKIEDPKEIIINSSGGTEKMSCIIKDLCYTLRQKNYNVKHVFGSVSLRTNEIIFTEVPDIERKSK